MSSELQQLTTQAAVLEERMETKQAEYKTEIGRLAEDAAKREADYKIELGRLTTDAAKRETRLVITVAAMFAAAVTVLGALISFQN